MNVISEQVQELAQMNLSQIYAMQEEVFRALGEAHESDERQKSKLMSYLDLLSIAEEIVKREQGI